MNKESAISVQHIKKNYGNFRAVDDLTFDVFGGEIFAILGPNGSGKTTTIRMILDILKPDTGTISVLGAPFSEATKAQIGYLPEERGLYKSVPVLEMMVYLGTLKGMSASDAKERSLALLKRLELEEHTKSKLSDLSKGMQQKVQFGVTVLHRPRLIIVDEPFSGLDPVNTLLIQDLLFDFKREGGAIVMSTHQMHQIEAMADRLLMISRGKQMLYGAVGDVRRQYARHAIWVEGNGDWAQLPGVERVEAGDNGKRGVLLTLGATTEPDSVLKVIAESPDYQIDRFELAVPSLNDIFIEVVEGQRHA